MSMFGSSYYLVTVTPNDERRITVVKLNDYEEQENGNKSIETSHASQLPEAEESINLPEEAKLYVTYRQNSVREVWKRGGKTLYFASGEKLAETKEDISGRKSVIIEEDMLTDDEINLETKESSTPWIFSYTRTYSVDCNDFTITTDGETLDIE